MKRIEWRLLVRTYKTPPIQVLVKTKLCKLCKILQCPFYRFQIFLRKCVWHAIKIAAIINDIHFDSIYLALASYILGHNFKVEQLDVLNDCSTIELSCSDVPNRELKIYNANLQRGRAYRSLLFEWKPSPSCLFLRQLHHFYDTLTAIRNDRDQTFIVWRLHIFPPKLPSKTTWYLERFVVTEVPKNIFLLELPNMLLASLILYIFSSKISYYLLW